MRFEASDQKKKKPDIIKDERWLSNKMSQRHDGIAWAETNTADTGEKWFTGLTNILLILWLEMN